MIQHVVLQECPPDARGRAWRVRSARKGELLGYIRWCAKAAEYAFYGARAPILTAGMLGAIRGALDGLLADGKRTP